MRLVAKKQTLTFNGRRDLRAVLGDSKDGVLTYDHPSSRPTADFRLYAAKRGSRPRSGVGW